MERRRPPRKRRSATPAQASKDASLLHTSSHPDSALSRGETAGLALAGPIPPEAAVEHSEGRRRVVAAAGIIALGQLLSSVLGFLRITLLNILFGQVASGPFIIALRPIQQVSDLIVAGSVSGALIPTFVDYGSQGQRAELRRVYSTVTNLVLLFMTVAVAVVVLIAPALVRLETQDLGDNSQQVTVSLLRISAFSLYGLGLYAVTAALLYALHEVVYPAFAPGVYHIGVMVCGLAALLLAVQSLGLPYDAALHAAGSSAIEQARILGTRGLAVGAAVGAAGEFLLLVYGLRRVAVAWRPVLDLRHPAVRQILRLYGPIVLGLGIAVLYQNIDVYLVGHTPGDWRANATALQSGTTLAQFPVGLVAAALSFAVLPPLTAAATRGDPTDFKRTLQLGIRLGMLLMIPATVGLLVLARPLLALLFEHGACGSSCTARNVLALQNYAYELPFVALDQLLIAAFYARKNTVVPAVAGVVSILFYLVIAVPFAVRIGMPALAFADATKNSGHALILLVLLTLAIGDLGARELLGGIGRILLAAGAMTAVCLALLHILPQLAPGVFDMATTSGNALILLFAGGVGALTYVAVARWLDVEEIRLAGDIVRSQLPVWKHSSV